jgi:mitogen-activated protein kinase binding protein 1
MKGKRVMIHKKKVQGGNCVTLDKIIGITSKHNSSIAVNPLCSEIAYITSGVITFYSPNSNKQEYYLFNQNSKIFSCLAFSSNGKFLATGEGTCKQPEIAIWEFVAPRQPILIKKLKGHKYGVEWVAFSPDNSYLVSIGNEHDKGMFLWNWSQEKRVTSNKITKRILSISFNATGDFFVTGGVRNIKIWSFEKGKPVTTASSSTSDTKCMASKNLDLAEMKEKTFCSVAVSKESIFALTVDGILCIFSFERVMDKWMDLHAGDGFVLNTQGKYLLCGCSDGIIRCFDSETLEHIVTLPRPPPLGHANISPDKKRTVIPSEPNSSFADTVGLVLFDNNTKLYALYSDRTAFTWDISKPDNIIVYRASLHHSGSINQIQILPTSTLEVTKFVTASTDKTIRFWHLCHSDPKRLDTEIIKNVYSKEMSRIIYTSKSFEHFKLKQTENDGCIKCISCSPDGKHIASGDVEGVLRVYSVETLEEILSLQAHDSDIVTLDYNMHMPREGDCDKGKVLLASGSRDRLLHVFDAEFNYKPLVTIDDHNSSIADLAFIRMDGVDRLISCGADRSLVFRTIQSQNSIRYFQTIQKSKKCYSIQPHPIHKTIVIGEDKSIKVLMIESGKLVKEIEDYQEKGAKIVSDSNLKVAMDASGLILAVCNLDRTVRLIEYYSGKVLGKFNVGELVTSMVFSPNGKKLLTATNDGCIFIWRLSIDLTNAIRARMAQAPTVKQPDVEENIEKPKLPQEDIKQDLLKADEEPNVKCHESIMPSWAKADKKKKSPFEVVEDPIPGKWGQNAVKIEIDESPQKIEVFKGLDEIESDDDKEAPALPVDLPKLRESFILTKSVVINDFVEKEKEEDEEVKYEEIKEEIPNDEGNYIEDDEDLEDNEEKLPELEPEGTIVKNPLRQSLSSSFWQKKKDDHPEQIGLFKLERIESEPWHVPKINDFKKKKDNIEVQSQINDMKKQLQDIGILSIPKKPKKTEEVDPTPEILMDHENDIQEEIILEVPEEIPEDIKYPESPKNSRDSKKSKKNALETEKSVKKFDSPYTKQTLNESKSYVGFSLSESQFSQTVKITKDQYKQGFSDLKKSLQSVDSYFANIDTSDPDYSVSFEESYQERKEILDLLMSISGRLGEKLAYSQENDLLEKFSKKLISSFEKKLRRREKEIE